MKERKELKALRQKSDKELINLLNETYHLIRQERFLQKTKKSKDVTKIRKTRKKVAQILTILRERIERELSEESNEEKITRRSS